MHGSIDQRLAELDNELVGSFTVAQLRAAFQKALAPGQNWKDAITTITSAEDRELMVAAIEFHVGGPTTVAPRTFNRGGEQVTLLVVENAGYYVNIGA